MKVTETKCHGKWIKIEVFYTLHQFFLFNYQKSPKCTDATRLAKRYSFRLKTNEEIYHEMSVQCSFTDMNTQLLNGPSHWIKFQTVYENSSHSWIDRFVCVSPFILLSGISSCGLQCVCVYKFNENGMNWKEKTEINGQALHFKKM